MRSETSKRILNETSQETKDKVNDNVSKFLEMKNINTIRKVASAMDAVEVNSKLTDEWFKFENEIKTNPLLCELYQPQVLGKTVITHTYHNVFLNMIRLLRKNKLVYLDTNINKDKLQEIQKRIDKELENYNKQK